MSTQPTSPAYAGTTPEQPLYFRILRGEDDQLQLSKILVALALSVLSGYLAVQAQRAGSGPDQLKAAKMKYHRAVSRVAHGQAALWGRVAANADTRYDIARL